MSLDKKKAHHISVPISPHYNHFGNSTSDSIFDPPPAYQAPHLDSFHSTSNSFYQPTPPPQTVIIHRQPTRSKDACCWGCLAAMCLCFGAKECC
ncbi:hypothetical protein K501DRAFT_323715 [Backusella circina FSU 941]|nr:hypothetical protein K501DRAFT_323715 [Backusella circina FSU 941]